jgi:transcriptional regulator with XRE-family HTH domain
METKKMGALLRAARQAKNLTIEHLAHELDLSASGYGKIERGEVMPRLAKLEKICDLLGLDVASLLGYAATTLPTSPTTPEDLAIELATLRQEVATMRHYLALTLKEVASLRQELLG